VDTDNRALRDLLGAPRARLLEVLRCPSSTAVLARSLNVSPPAVSQHLAVLRRCGLVNRTRSGREVLYQTSDLGLALLDSPAAASGRRVATEDSSPTVVMYPENADIVTAVLILREVT